jgi:hyperosmotically inducible periplasmic protein
MNIGGCHRSSMRRAGIMGLAAMAAVLMLSGCAAAMLGGAARAGQSSSSAGTNSGSASPAARPASKIAADHSISTSVRSRFVANPALKPLKLAVDTHDGVVTLRGQVNSVEQRNAAQLEARAVKGVRAVKNELTVR